MASVKVHGVRITGETVIAARGNDVLMQDAAVQTVRLKNVSKRKTVTIQYTFDRKRVRCKLKPGQCVQAEFYMGTSGKVVRVDEDLFIEFSLETIDDSAPHRCPRCSMLLEEYEVGYCPKCGDGE